MQHPKIASQIWDKKYRLKDGNGNPLDHSVEDTWWRIARALAEAENGNAAEPDGYAGDFYSALEGYKYLPAGRITAGAGTGRHVTLFNCYVMGTIPDSMDGIFSMLREAALTMQQGGGIGYDFSTLRPKGALVRGVAADASGPLTFMDVWDAMCRTVMSAGERRGAMMATMRCDHPDIEAFIEAKRDASRLRMFNLSVLVTDDFMEAVRTDSQWHLHFENRQGETISEKWVNARELWNKIIRTTYDVAEPGVIFIDRINQLNNLGYCETIAATNPSMPAETLVASSLGVTPISELEGKEFQVQVSDGTWLPAECRKSGTDQELLELDLGSGRKIHCTPEHKWPVLLNGRYVRVAASELKPGDLIQEVPARGPHPDLRPDLTYADGLVSGLIFGDGTIGIRKDTERAFLGYYAPEAESYLVNQVAEYFTAKVTRSGGMVNTQLAKDQAVRAWATKVGFSLEHPKDQLPKALYTANPAFFWGFFNGWASADGCVTAQETLVLINKSENVLREAQKLLGLHGVRSLVNVKQAPSSFPNGKDYNKLYTRGELKIAGAALVGFASQVAPLAHIQKNEKLAAQVAKSQGKRTPQRGLRLKAVKPSKRADVWDISVYGHEHVFPAEYCFTGNCGEQPLPPYGACLLGSVNLARLVNAPFTHQADLDMDQLDQLVATAVRMMDNVVDVSLFPVPQQAEEAKAKRRIGLGVTGLADALAMCRLKYGSPEAVKQTEEWIEAITLAAYSASIELAKEKGAFPLFNADGFLRKGSFAAERLPIEMQDDIRRYGIRNALLTSIAPTGTISLYAGNVSSGIEPIFAYSYTRKVLQADGSKVEEEVVDYAVALYQELYPGEELPDYFVTAQELQPKHHLFMQAAAQQWIDSSISKTINVPEAISFEDFRDVYEEAYEMGCKGCTTYRPNDVTGSVLEVKKPEVTKSKKDTCISHYPDGRPKVLTGETYKLKWPNEPHAFYITFTDQVDMAKGTKRPFEIFINSKNVDHFQWTVALTRMVSAVFRRGGNVSFVASELQEVFDPKGGAFMGGKYVPSLLAAIGGIVAEHMQAIGYGDFKAPVLVDEEPPTDLTFTAIPQHQCKDCGSYNAKKEAGCFVCKDCGSSKCG